MFIKYWNINSDWKSAQKNQISVYNSFNALRFKKIILIYIHLHKTAGITKFNGFIHALMYECNNPYRL